MCFTTINQCFGQNTQNIQAFYKYTNYGTNQKYDITLLVNETKALSIFKKKDEKALSLDEKNNNISFSKQYYDDEGQKYFIDSKKKEIIFRDFVYDGEDKSVIVTEKLPDYEWDFKSEVKQIGKYECYLAELSFRGRDFLVWFNPKINIPFGPWKFYGLPGLIVYIQSKDKNIEISLNEIVFHKSSNINVPTNGENISFEQYVNYKEKEVYQFIKKLKSKLPRGAKVTVNETGESYNLEKEYY